MKKLMSLLLALALINLTFVSCEKDKDDGTPPELPPVESMQLDFTEFGVPGNKSAVNSESSASYDYAAVNVFVFNVILTAATAIPVATFAASFNQTAVSLGDNIWQWTAVYEAFGGNYTARLTGKVNSDNVNWEMYVMREGINAFDEFMWYEGTSKIDGTGGSWTLNHSAEFQEPLLNIEWERTGEEMGEVKYTVVRELNDDRTANEDKGSYIAAGKLVGDLNAYYTIYSAPDAENVSIEWSTTGYYGRVMSEVWFQDTEWHCWDNVGEDTDCE